MSAQSIAGGGGGSYQLRDLFNGSSRDTALWNATTVVPGWAPGVTIGGTETESSGVVTITPTASADRIEGRSSVATNLVLTGKEMWLHLSSSPALAHTFMFGYSNTANRGGQNIRWRMEHNGSSGTLTAQYNNLGGGTPWSDTYSSSTHAWLGIVDTGTDMIWYTAPDSSGSPGTPVERRRVIASGGDYFDPSAGDVGFWVQNEYAIGTTLNVSVASFWLTA